MPAVAVRHERRRQEKRSKRPSQLYLGGPWLPPPSPSPTPSPGTNGLNYDGDDHFPEYYVCGKVSALQIVVGSLLLGAIVLVVGLVQLTPGAADADHRWILLGTGGALIIIGLVMTGVRCCCMHYDATDTVAVDDETPHDVVSSIDVLVQRRDTQITSPSELDALIGQRSRGSTECHEINGSDT
ncbi:hypothetical protein CBL_09476 [Carabus blaptoides fortunei]